ncbi:MAG TPA: vitamin K epoxide reductase family protein [Solirubrobacteraceae bacterium]|nr:vitamin K epoxide reductase family protein [Solirubrobacteraceae bacterium]
MSTKLRWAMVAIAVLGLALASYLVYVHYSGSKPVCTTSGACLKVQTSVYSKLAGVPVALIGLIGYVAIFGSLLVRDRDEVRLATLGMTVIGVCFSGYLTYREVFTLKTICEECAASAVLMLILFLLAAARYVLGDPAPTPPAPPPSAPTSGSKRATRHKIAS